MNRVTITIDNSYSKINGLTSTQFKKLKKVLSYITDPQIAYFNGGFQRRKYLIDAKGSFPTGLLAKVRKFAPEAHINDNRNIPIRHIKFDKADIFHPVPHEWQLDAIEKALKSGRGGIVAPTGTGKSLVIALLALRLGLKVLCVVPTIEIKNQLKEALNTFKVNNVTVENIDSKNLYRESNYDCLIIDECHHVAARTYQNLNKKYWKKIYYRYFLTATWGRNNNNENLLFEGIAGEVIYKLSYKEAVKKNYIVPVEAYYIELPKKDTEAFTWAQVYKELVVENEYRNEIILDLFNSLDKAQISTLCLVKEVKHGHNLKGYYFANGQDENSRKFIKDFNKRHINILIGTTGILGEGVDTKPCEYVIIAGLGKAKSAFLQQIGRGVRVYPNKESCKVIIFKDASHKFTLRHYKEQCKILKEELGIVPMKLDI